MKTKKIKALIVEDSEDDLKLLLREFNKSSYKIIYKSVQDAKGMETALKEDWDVIISDYSLPGFTGIEALKMCNEKGIDIPFIILSGTVGEDIAVDTMKYGAKDYIMKNNLIRLLPAIEREIEDTKIMKERKHAEEELKESEKRYRKVVNISPEAIIIHSDGKIVFVNPASLQILGASNFDDLLGKSAIEFVHPDERDFVGKRISEIIKSGNSSPWVEERFIKMDGSIIYVETIGTPTTYHGKPAVQVIIRDISERKRAEETLRKAKEHAEESDRLKSAFLANMSHEIRTPMNGILGFADLLKEPKLTREEHQKFISIIEKSSERMLNIINDIVDISKIESGQMEVSISEININEQIEYIYTFFKPEVEGKGMQINFQNTLPSREAIINTDKEKICAILSNLVKNAIKYCDNGTIEIGYNLKDKYLEFFVKDTGIGIAKDRQEAIFERFIQADIANTRALQGAGLGLSISKAYAEILGGKIWVESEEEKGSVFYFTIPYNAGTKEKTVIKNVVTAKNKEGEIKKLKILIAEDDETSGLYIKLAVKKFSKEILKVKTGAEAVEVCLKNKDIDLVLMDIKMPGMNGYEASRQIRQFNKEVVIIAQTAYALMGDREKAIEAGCNDYISKPINQDLLEELIKKIF